MEIQESGLVFEPTAPIEKTKEIEERFSKKWEEVEEEEESDREPLFDGPVTVYQNPPAENISLSLSKTSAEKKREELKAALVPPLVSSHKQGIGKTHLLIETKSLSLIEVVIDHYDTSPSCFYIRLMGDLDAQKFFQKNRILLQTQLKAALPTFQCSFAPFSFRPRSFLLERQRKNSLVKSSRLSYREDKEVKDLYE
jgi:hypothetical protein